MWLELLLMDCHLEIWIPAKSSREAEKLWLNFERVEISVAGDLIHFVHSDIIAQIQNGCGTIARTRYQSA